MKTGISVGHDGDACAFLTFVFPCFSLTAELFFPLQCLKFHVIIIRYPSGLENPDRVYQLDLCVCVVIFTPLEADGYGKTTIVLDMLLFGGRVPESEAWSVPGPLVSQSVLCFMSVHSKVILDPLKNKIK